jgi:membrane-associated phospholipid phosphatase
LPFDAPAHTFCRIWSQTAVKHYTFVDYATQAYLALVALLILFFHNGTVPHWPWLLAGHCLAMALVHGLIQARERYPANRTLGFLGHFYPVLLFAPLFCETGRLNRMFFPHYLDALAIRCDQALFGWQPGAMLMAKLPWLPLSELLYAAYFSYYVMIGGVGLILFLRSRQQFFHYVSVVCFVFYICYLIYIVLPIVGPQVLSHEIPGYSLPPDLEYLATDHAYPDAVKAGPFFQLMAWIYRVFEAPGAALPSSHVAIALCTVFFSFRYLRRIRFLHLATVVLLCFSTVYCHYHYGIDVLTGIVTAATLVPLGNWLYSRSVSRSGPGAKVQTAFSYNR